MYKTVENKVGVNAKRAVEKQSKEFIKKEKKSSDFEYNLIMSFM